VRVCTKKTGPGLFHFTASAISTKTGQIATSPRQVSVTSSRRLALAERAAVLGCAVAGIDEEIGA